MDLFDTLTWAEILVKTTFLGTPTLIVPKSKITENWSKLNGISTIYVLQFVKAFTIYYIKCVCPRIWVSKVYVQELRWKSMKKFQVKNLIIKSFLASRIEKKNTFWDISTKPKIGIL
jgi:hypothetical protein